MSIAALVAVVVVQGFGSPFAGSRWPTIASIAVFFADRIYDPWRRNAREAPSRRMYAQLGPLCDRSRRENPTLYDDNGDQRRDAHE